MVQSLKNAGAAAASAFTGTAQSVAEKLSPKGKPVSWSATPKALWGNAKDGAASATEFLGATATQQKERAAGVQAQVGQLQDKIGERVGTLEKKWLRQRLDDKTTMLKDFSQRADLTPEERAKLEANVQKSEELGAEIQKLAAEMKANYPPKDAAAAELREHQKSHLCTLRRHQRRLVSEAKELIASKTENNVVLLAENEKNLDPNAPVGEGESLMSMLGDWLHLTSVSEFFVKWMAEKDRKAQEEAIKEADRLLIDRRQREKEGVLKQDFSLLQRGLKFGA